MFKSMMYDAGKKTVPFQRTSAANSRSEHCLSIKIKSRSLDLEASSARVRDGWLMGLYALLGKSVTYHGILPMASASPAEVKELREKLDTLKSKLARQSEDAQERLAAARTRCQEAEAKFEAERVKAAQYAIDLQDMKKELEECRGKKQGVGNEEDADVEVMNANHSSYALEQQLREVRALIH